MVNYKLTYFPLRGRAESIRHLFIYSGIGYEEKTISSEQWPEFKTSVPFGQLPMLEVDGHRITQSLGIARFLAKRFDLAGKNAWETAMCDMIGDQMNDFLIRITPIRAALVNQDRMKALIEVAIAKTTVFPTFLAVYESFLNHSGTGWLVGNQVTWVDFLVADWMNRFVELDPTLLEGYPLLNEHLQKIESIPQIKQRIEQRPYYKI